jgi:hypothetical protein
MTSSPDTKAQRHRMSLPNRRLPGRLGGLCMMSGSAGSAVADERQQAPHASTQQTPCSRQQAAGKALMRRSVCYPGQLRIAGRQCVHSALDCQLWTLLMLAWLPLTHHAKVHDVSSCQSTHALCSPVMSQDLRFRQWCAQHQANRLCMTACHSATQAYSHCKWWSAHLPASIMPMVIACRASQQLN